MTRVPNLLSVAHVAVSDAQAAKYGTADLAQKVLVALKAIEALDAEMDMVLMIPSADYARIDPDRQVYTVERMLRSLHADLARDPGASSWGRLNAASNALKRLTTYVRHADDVWMPRNPPVLQRA